MAQKVDISDNQKTPKPVRFTDIVHEVPENLSGIRPYIEEPEVAKEKAIRKSILLMLLILVITGGLVFFAFRSVGKIAKSMQDKHNLIYLANQQMQISDDL